MAMTKEEAHKLLRDAGVVTDSYDIAEGATQDYGDMFAVYVHRKKYLQSGDINDMECGSGATLVEKATGKIHQTGSAYDAGHYVEAVRATGTTSCELTNKVTISAVPDGADFRQLAPLIADSTAHGDLESRQVAKQIIANEVTEVSCVFFKESALFRALKALGYGCEQVWDMYPTDEEIRANLEG